MSNKTIAFLLAVGAAAWVYTKAFRQTGGNRKTATIATVFCGLIVFFVVWIALNTFIK